MNNKVLRTLRRLFALICLASLVAFPVFGASQHAASREKCATPQGLYLYSLSGQEFIVPMFAFVNGEYTDVYGKCSTAQECERFFIDYVEGREFVNGNNGRTIRLDKAWFKYWNTNDSPSKYCKMVFFNKSIKELAHEPKASLWAGHLLDKNIFTESIRFTPDGNDTNTKFNDMINVDPVFRELINKARSSGDMLLGGVTIITDIIDRGYAYVRKIQANGNATYITSLRYNEKGKPYWEEGVFAIASTSDVTILGSSPASPGAEILFIRDVDGDGVPEVAVLEDYDPAQSEDDGYLHWYGRILVWKIVDGAWVNVFKSSIINLPEGML